MSVKISESLTLTNDEIEDMELATLTVAQVRAYFDAEGLPEDFEHLLDTAQGEIMTGENSTRRFILVEITE